MVTFKKIVGKNVPEENLKWANYSSWAIVAVSNWGLGTLTFLNSTKVMG